MAWSAGSPPAFRRPGTLIETSEVLRDVDVRVAPTGPPAEPREHEPHRDRHRIVERRGVVAHPSADDRGVHHHLAPDIAHDAPTEPDDPPAAILELTQHPGAPEADRKREPHPAPAL